MSDDAIHNGSSIAFMLSEGEKNVIFLSDSYPSVIVESLKNLDFSTTNPVNAELVKLSHHGSKYNNSSELYSLLKSEKFAISSDGEKHGHPHKKTISRIINLNNSCHIYFNYPISSEIFLDEDHKDFPNVSLIHSTTIEIEQ